MNDSPRDSRRSHATDTRETAMDFLRGRVFPLLTELSETLGDRSPDETLLALLTATGNHLDALSPQHPGLRSALDGLNKACIEVAERLFGKKEPALLQPAAASRLQRVLPRIESTLAAHGLASYEAATALLQGAIAQTLEREGDFATLSELRERELLPLSRELLTHLVEGQAIPFESQ